MFYLMRQSKLYMMIMLVKLLKLIIYSFDRMMND